MNKLFKIVLSSVLILSLKVQALFLGVQVVRNKVTGSIVSGWKEWHDDLSDGVINTLKQRREIIDAIEFSRMRGYSVSVAAEDYSEKKRIDIIPSLSQSQEIKQVLMAADQSLTHHREAFKLWSQIFQHPSVNDLITLECQLRDIRNYNVEVRDLRSSMWQNSSNPKADCKGAESLKRLIRFQTIQKIKNLKLPAAIQSLLINHIYNSQPKGQIHERNIVLNMAYSFYYQVDIEMFLHCLQNKNIDHVFVLGGGVHTEACIKLLLDSGLYEPVCSLGVQDIGLLPPKELWKRILVIPQLLKLLYIAPFDIKNAFAEIQKTIATLKPVVPVIKAKL